MSSGWSTVEREISFRRLQQTLLLSVAMILAGYARTAISPIQDQIKIDLGMNDTSMAILQGAAVGIPIVLFAFNIGLIIDRVSRVRVVRIFGIIILFGMVLTAIAPSFPLMALSRALTGVAALSMLPIVVSVLSEYYKPEGRGKSVMFMIAAQAIGNALAFVAGGWLLSAVGGTPHDWRETMWWICVPVVPMLLSTFWLREPMRADSGQDRPSFASAVHQLIANRQSILPVASGVIFLETALIAMLVWALPMLTRRFAISPESAGGVMALSMLAGGIIGPILGGITADYCQRTGGSKKSLRVLMVLSLLCFPVSLFSWVDGEVAVKTMLILAMTIFGMSSTMGMTAYTVVVPANIRGLCMNLLVAMISLVGLVGAPLLVSGLAINLGGEAMIGRSLSIISISCCVLAMASFLVGLLLMSGVKASNVMNIQESWH